jgi:hypothetical protein
MKAAYIKRYGKIEDVQLDVQPEPSISKMPYLLRFMQQVLILLTYEYSKVNSKQSCPLSFHLF